MRRKVEKNLIIKLHCSRGLNYISLGEYYFQAPKKDNYKHYSDLISHEDDRKFISMTIIVEDLTGHCKYSSLDMR